MKNYSIKLATAGISLLSALSTCTALAQSSSSTPSAKQQAKDTATNSRAFDGNHEKHSNSTLNTRANTGVTVPTVTSSSSTVSGVSKSSTTATGNGNSNPQLQKLSNQSLHINVPPPAPAPKPQPKPEPKKDQPVPKGTVPTGK